jgi:hypothetical protein
MVPALAFGALGIACAFGPEPLEPGDRPEGFRENCPPASDSSGSKSHYLAETP